VATEATVEIMRLRYGPEFAQSAEPLAYGERIERDGVELQLQPAGHVLGSAQAVVRWRGVTAVVSGDYKRRTDPTCASFEPVPCHLFISEATFGLPVFRHPPAEGEVAKLLASREQFPERAHLVGAYALGKAQRIIRLIRLAGYEDVLYIHGALHKLNGFYERSGVDLGALSSVAEAGSRRDYAGAIIIAPPSALNDRWSRRFPDPVTAFASGWMRVRARVRQRGVELPLIVSDHADWDELTATIAELAPEELWITHGREEGLQRWSALNGVKAKALALVGYEEEDDEAGSDPVAVTA
jgi:putative mRNA 3-end processing factor